MPLLISTSSLQKQHAAQAVARTMLQSELNAGIVQQLEAMLTGSKLFNLSSSAADHWGAGFISLATMVHV
jgi:hypothetical protein